MINVLFIAYYFPPIGGAGVQRSIKFVRHLPDFGYRPIVVTGQGTSEDRWTPSDSALEREISPNTVIYRIPAPHPVPDTRWKRRMKSWLGMQGSFSKWWVPSVVQIGAEAISKEGPGLIFASMSPFESARAAAVLSGRHGVPWVADLRDPWALDEMKVYPSAAHRRLDERKMFMDLSSASAIIMNTPEATNALIKRFPTLRNKIVSTITNGYDAEDFSGDLPPRRDGKFRIVHSGYLHTDSGMELRRKRLYYRILGGAKNGVDILTRSHIFLLKAIDGLMEEDPSAAQEIEVVFVGSTTPSDEHITLDSRWQNVIRYTGYIPHDESVRMVRTADLLFLPMHNLPVGRSSTIVPGKAYEYMAAGKPILAAVPEGDAKEYLELSGMAYVCRPDDYEEMRKLLRRAYQNWKAGTEEKKKNIEYISLFERAVLTKQLAEVFNKVLAT